VISESFRKKLENSTRCELHWDEPMKRHTSIRIGGNVEVLVVIKSQDEIQKVMQLSNEYDVPLTVIGNGSKLLVGDNGLSGLVLKISKGYDAINIMGNKMYVQAGCSLPFLAMRAADKSLSGLESLVGIPGTIGAAIIMNAGAHNHDISESVVYVDVLDYNGIFSRLYKEELNFEYRGSYLQNEKYVVTGIELELKSDSQNSIKAKMQNYLDWRIKNQPHKYPNAGSIFKNPPEHVAGRLIDEAGLKGMIYGGAKISEQKANFFENIDNAKASDIIHLMRISQKAVFNKYGIKLEPEIRIIGHHVND